MNVNHNYFLFVMIRQFNNVANSDGCKGNEKHWNSQITESFFPPLCVAVGSN